MKRINITLLKKKIYKKKNLQVVLKHLLAAIGPQRASFLKVQNLLISSKCNPEGHLFKYGYPSTHYRNTNNSRVKIRLYFL